MRTVDYLSAFEGRSMFFLTPDGWYGRPWDTPFVIDSIAETVNETTTIRLGPFKLEFRAVPFDEVIAFGEAAFTVFPTGVMILTDANTGESNNRNGLYSFVSADRELPYRDSDIENIVVTYHNKIVRDSLAS